MPQSTSGASEIIFMNWAVRSSRVTGPKIRVPTGCRAVLSNTAALLSKRIDEPSVLRTPFFVRTITALYTSPFLTRPLGIASLILILMTLLTAYSVHLELGLHNQAFLLVLIVL